MSRRRLTREQLKEFIKCRNDVVYFITTYGYFKHSTEGAVKWDKPYPYQVEFWESLASGENVIVNKTRQIGCSWACAAYGIWLILFRPGIEVLFISETEKKAIRLLSMSRFIYENLPGFLVPTIGANSQTRLSFKFLAERDGKVRSYESSIDSLTLTKRSAASYTAGLIIFDEAAHAENSEDVFMAAKPAISHGGQMAIVSTPGGRVGNAAFFFRLWMEAMRDIRDGKKPEFKPIKAYWRDCGLSEEWFEKAAAGMTKQQILQEFELVFLSTGSPFFDIEQLEKCYHPYGSPVLDIDGTDISGKTRLSFTGVDTAEGNKTKAGVPDYTSIVTLNEYGVEIASWHSNETPVEEVAGYSTAMEDGNLVDVEGIVTEWHREYPGVMAIERFGPGDVVYLRHSRLVPDDERSYVVGRRTTSASKQRMLNTLKLAIAGKQVIIRDPFTYECLQAFEDKGRGKYEATEGFFDDPVIALALAYSELSKYGGYRLELPDEVSGGRRVVSMQREGDIDPMKIEEFLPVGSGPILDTSGETTRMTDEVDRW